MKDFPDFVLNHIVTNDDGRKVFWPDGSLGYMDSHFMRKMADHLDELNKHLEDNDHA